MISQLLCRVPYFTQLADEQLVVLAQHAIRRSFVPNGIIFMEGESSAGLWILESGNVKAYKLAANGDEYVLRLFSAGDTFNDVAALDYGPNPSSAAAMGDVTAWVIPTDTLHQLLDVDHTLALAVIQGLAGRLRWLVLQVEDLALRSVTGRLARFLLEQVNNTAEAAPPVTRTLIASHLATTPETVSRVLRSLEGMGAIQFDRHRIVIVKPDLLREIALL
jgi:CRP/FNR family transcriptional regulator